MDRSTIICLVVGFLLAFGLMIPNFAYYYDFTLPNNGFPVSYLTNGANYMAVFFHEIGHTAAAWVFGYPSLPMFDFEHGGGLTTGAPQVWLLVAFFWLTTMYIFVDSWKKNRVAFWMIGVLLVLHIYAVSGDLHRILISFMGHGGELMVASFLLYRAIAPEGWLGKTERYLASTIGFFLLMTNMRSFWGLMFSDIEQIAYENQKGGLHLGDFSKIAEHMSGIPIEYVAGFAMVWAIAALAAPFLIYFLVGYDARLIERLKERHRR